MRVAWKCSAPRMKQVFFLQFNFTHQHSFFQECSAIYQDPQIMLQFPLWHHYLIKIIFSGTYFSYLQTGNINQGPDLQMGYAAIQTSVYTNLPRQKPTCDTVRSLQCGQTRVSFLMRTCWFNMWKARSFDMCIACFISLICDIFWSFPTFIVTRTVC